MPNMDVTKEEMELIDKIVCRLEQLHAHHDLEFDRFAFGMDLVATHKNGCPLDLSRLLAAPNFDFSHDCAGISRHLNRKTGQLEGCFSPRYSARQEG